MCQTYSCAYIVTSLVNVARVKKPSRSQEEDESGGSRWTIANRHPPVARVATCPGKCKPIRHCFFSTESADSYSTLVGACNSNSILLISLFPHCSGKRLPAFGRRQTPRPGIQKPVRPQQGRGPGPAGPQRQGQGRPQKPAVLRGQAGTAGRRGSSSRGGGRGSRTHPAPLHPAEGAP